MTTELQRRQILALTSDVARRRVIVTTSADAVPWGHAAATSGAQDTYVLDVGVLSDNYALLAGAVVIVDDLPPAQANIATNALRRADYSRILSASGVVKLNAPWLHELDTPAGALVA